MRRRAGIFEAPPAMMDEVGAFLRQVMAGHVLFIVENAIEQLEDAEAPFQRALDEMKTALASAEAQIRNLKPGKSVRFPLALAPTRSGGGPRTFFLGVKRNKSDVAGTYGGVPFEDHYWIATGNRRVTYPEWLGDAHPLDFPLDKVPAAIELHIRRLERYMRTETLGAKRPGADDAVDRLRALATECRKHTTKAKHYRSAASRNFQINLFGWKYIKPNSPIIQSVNEHIRQRNAVLENRIREAQESLKNAQKLYDAAVKADADWDTFKNLSGKYLGKSTDEVLTRYFMDEPGVGTFWDRSRVWRAVLDRERPAIIATVVQDHSRAWVPVAEAEALIRSEIGPAEVERALQIRNWDQITVTLSFQPQKKSVGVWKSFQRNLRVDIPEPTVWNVAGFQDALAEAMGTLRHELQHVGQDVLAAVLMLKDTGLPSRNIRNLEYDAGGAHRERWQDPKKEHALQDVEFYTRLADEVEYFVQFIQKRSFAPQDRYLAFRTWVDDADPRGTVGPTRVFFHKLKQEERGKWRKAVGEFLKAVGEEVEISDPAARRVASRWLRTR